MTPDSAVECAAEALRDSEAILFTAGAGMGVDSGLPDFRGDAGFWKAYPLFAKLGLSFVDLADPRWFAEDPALAWGFYGHRLNLYRATAPHRGFARLLAVARGKTHGAFVFTSNVDGHFQRAGFEETRVVECHGAIETSQCATPCGDALFASARDVTVDPTTFRATGPLPRCPRCGGLARPNILMFGDGDFVGTRTGAQRARLNAWLTAVGAARARVVVLELGAGLAVPTVRLTSEAVAQRTGGTLIRVNPREPETPPGGLSIAAAALEAIEALTATLGQER